jgi:hypothetical protein
MRRTAPLLALLFLVTGCYHAQIHTGEIASPTVIENQWAHSFIGGLVPPSPLDASGCTAGVARVETVHSVPNLLAHIVTFGIYSPMTMRAVCAAGQDDEQEEQALYFWMPEAAPTPVAPPYRAPRG